jgi:hypothetical protein
LIARDDERKQHRAEDRPGESAARSAGKLLGHLT